MKVDVVNQQGEKVDTINLNPEIFEAKINPTLMAQAVRVLRANKRQGTAKTKTRGEVSGGGRKPWRQKHTGRARHGSTRSPIWVGGGHAKAKKPRDYSLKIPKRMRQAALFSALSAQVKDQNLLVIDDLILPEINTKEANLILKKISPKKKLLIILPENNHVIAKSLKNLPTVKTLSAQKLNTYDVLNYENLIFMQKSLKVLEKTFLGESELKKTTDLRTSPEKISKS